MACDVKPADAFLSQVTGVLASYKHLWKDVFQFPFVLFGSDQGVELAHHLGRVSLCLGVHRNHTGSVSNTKHLLTCKLPVNVSCKLGKESDLRNVRFLVQDALIQV